MLYCDTPAVLKQKMPGALLAISSAAGRRARDAIARAPGVTQAVLVGSGVHVVVDDADLRIPQLRAALRAAEVPFSDIAQATPSVEDVFLALVEHDGPQQ